MAITRIPTINYQSIDIDESVGEGGCSKVKRGTWQGKSVAIKEYKDSSDEIPISALREFEHELDIYETIAAGQHPDKAYVTEVFACIKEPIYAIVMEYAQVGSLEQCIDSTKKTPLAWPLRRKIIEESAQAIRYLHNLNIIHADIKSGNILITSFNLTDPHHVKLCDFNYAVHVDLITKPESHGTIEYIAPELMEGKCRQKASDVFSFGQLMCEISMWRQLFEYVNNDLELIWRLVTGNLDEIPNDTPEDIAAWIQRARKLQPQERPTMEEIVNGLGTASQTSTVESTRLLLEKLTLNKTQVLTAALNRAETNPHIIKKLSPQERALQVVRETRAAQDKTQAERAANRKKAGKKYDFWMKKQQSNAKNQQEEITIPPGYTI